MADSFACPFCGARTYNPFDAKHRYCGWCHVFVDDELDRILLLANGPTGWVADDYDGPTIKVSPAEFAAALMDRWQRLALR